MEAVLVCKIAVSVYDGEADRPMGRQLRGLSETRQQFREYICPLGSLLSPKNRKRTPKKGASLEKIQKPPPKNVCPEIGSVALDHLEVVSRDIIGST
jgi:hypothetical protein